MMGCFATNSLCEKVKGDWHQLASSMYKLPVDPNPSEETKAIEAALLEKITAVCHECQTAQLIKCARADVKLANKAFKDEEAKSFGLMFAIYKRLVTEKPEFEEVYAMDTALFECALEHEAEWIAHGQLLDDLYEKVVEAKKTLDAINMLNKVQLDH